MQITFLTESLTAHDVQVLRAIMNAVASEQPQPEVGDNTGTSGTGINLSPGAAGVSEGADPVAATPAPSAPEKRKPGRPKKEAAVEQPRPSETGAGGSEAPSASPAAQPASAAASSAPESVTTAAPAQTVTLTLDDVRSKLQAFTGANGIDAGLALLQEFGAGRVSELKTEHYSDFVAKCEVK